MGADTSTNATLTQDQVERILIQPLVQASSFLRLGVPTFTSNGEPIKVPTLSTFGTPSYVAQGSAVSLISPTTSEVELLPDTVYSIKVMAKVTNELVRQSVVNVESTFSNKIVSDVTRVLDYAMWQGGTATTGSPIGIANMTGFTNAGTAAGTAVTSDHLYDMDQQYVEAFGDPDSAVWVFSPANWTIVRKLTDNYGARVWQPPLSAGAPSTLLGHPYVVTTHYPSTSISLFDKNQVAVGMDNRASIGIFDQTYAAEDSVGIRVTARYDVQPLHAAAIVKKTIT